MKKAYYYQPIIRAIADNGSDKFGVNAVTQIWDETAKRKMELSVFGNNANEAFEKLRNSLKSQNDVEGTEFKCEYYLCSEIVVEIFKPFEVSKPFKSGYDFDKRSFYYVAWLNFEEVEKYYNEIIKPHNDKSQEGKHIDFWLEECVAGTMDVSKITLSGAKKNGLFCEIEEKISITVEKNRAMTIHNLADRFGCTPVRLINKYL